MAPKTPKTKIPAKNNNVQSTPNDVAGSAINYAEAQNDEIEVLKAIYMDDFREIASQSAWKQAADHKFELTLRAFSDPESYVKLSVSPSPNFFHGIWRFPASNHSNCTRPSAPANHSS